MGLILNRTGKTTEKEIKILNTDYSVENVYVRLQVTLLLDGIHLGFKPEFYASKAKYLENISAMIPVDIRYKQNFKGFEGIVVPKPEETEGFGIQCGLQRAKEFFISLGYDCEINSVYEEEQEQQEEE